MGTTRPIVAVEFGPAETSPAALAPRSDSEERPSFDEVFENCSGFVWSVLAKLGVPSADVPDVCQDVFIVVHRRLPDFDGRTALRSWIYGICVRTASDYRRRMRGRKEQPMDLFPEPAVPAPQDEELERRRARALLEAVLDDLGEEKRAVFVLYELEELTMGEVAAALGCPLQTAYSRLYAARTAVTNAFRRFAAKRSIR
jgi:RNA polymerase sigma-70 factor (ECF subfamily)